MTDCGSIRKPSSYDLNSDTSTSQATQNGVNLRVYFLPYMHLNIISMGICIRSHIIVEVGYGVLHRLWLMVCLFLKGNRKSSRYLLIVKQ